MTERIYPSIMLEAAAEEKKDKTQETARVQNIELGKCPICHAMLVNAKADGLDVTYCPDHNIVMPLKD